MRVLTFGWEFPPVKIGGLGVACHGLTQALVQSGIEVIFVLPRRQEVDGLIKFIFADIDPGKLLETENYGHSYMDSNSYIEYIDPVSKKVRYRRSIIQQVHQYAHVASKISMREEFDVIHAHDWTSYLAGVAAKVASGKPLIVHAHITSFDQAGGGMADPEILAIEKYAFQHADRIVTVSNYTKNIIVEKHGVDRGKIDVVYNGAEDHKPAEREPVLREHKAQGKKIVLYHGRITIQKGVDYFIRAARKVVDIDPNVLFVISGSGDTEREMMHLVGSLGLSRHVIFAGALWDEERDRMYQAADLFVMPSVSEPFGLVALEAIQHGTPVLISKQSGVSEVLTHALKVDFWDIDEMTNKIVAALHYDSMNRQLVTEGKREVLRLSWRKAARKVSEIYNRLLDWIHKKV